MVLNPGTIVNTEREVILLRAQLKARCLMDLYRWIHIDAPSEYPKATEATPDEAVEKRKELEEMKTGPLRWVSRDAPMT